MRIGITTHNYPPHLGGVETVARELSRGFAAAGHEVVLVSTAWDGKSGTSTENGVVVYRVPAWHGTEKHGVPYPLPVGPGVGRAFRALRACDVLHAHGSLYTTTLLARAARRRGVPLFVTEHVGFVTYPSRAVNAIERIAWGAIGSSVVGAAAQVIAVNSRVHEWLAARFGPDRVRLIPNGVDAARFAPRDTADREAARNRLGLPVNERLGLFVGRDAQKKNLDVVLQFPAPPYRLVVCGTSRSLPAEVLNLGTLPYSVMPDVFAAADFLLHAATGEGFPVVVQEAMASGLPVALLWDPGYASSVDRDSVMAADSLEELSAAARCLGQDAALRSEFGRRAREEAVSRWNWGKTVERHLDAFRQAAPERQSRA